MFGLLLEQLRADDVRTLRQVFVGGEALLVSTIEKWFHLMPDVALHDVYGPTETTVDVTALHCTPEVFKGVKPLGKPLTNV